MNYDFKTKNRSNMCLVNCKSIPQLAFGSLKLDFMSLNSLYSQKYKGDFILSYSLMCL